MFLNSLNIAGSGLTAQRTRMDVISQNIANQDTAAYRRKVAVLTEATRQETGVYPRGNAPDGVNVAAITDDMSPFKLIYDPGNPEAGPDGYVRLPNVDLTTEMVDLMASSRSYEADVTAFNALKGMALTALEIGK